MFHDLRVYNLIGFQATTFLSMICISSLKKLLVIVACSKNERRKKEVGGGKHKYFVNSGL